MKKLVFLLLIISSITKAQENFSWGFKEGITVSQVTENMYRGYHKIGFAGGAFVKLKLSDNLNIGTEAVYTEFGSIKRTKHKKGQFNNYFLQLSYVQFPLLFQYHFQAFGIELGPGYGVLVEAKEIDVVDGIAYSGTNAFHKEDTNFNIGVSFTHGSRFGLNLRYTNSIVPIRTNDDKTGQKNNAFILFLTYEFGGEDPFW